MRPARTATSRFVKTACGRIAGAVASVLAPADCRACGGPLHGTATTFSSCEACLDYVRQETGRVCARCGERLAMEDVAGSGFSLSGDATRCEACAQTAPPFAGAWAFAAYDGVLSQLIRLHKFEGIEPLARELGRYLAAGIADAANALGGSPIRVIAVPLFRRRRRFNQSAALADAALRLLREDEQLREKGLVCRHEALRRVRETQSQSQLSPSQRRANVHGAFAVQGDVNGWRIVLVDDVYTTGATVTECSRTLLRAGAAEVRVVTLARAQPLRTAVWTADPDGMGSPTGFGMRHSDRDGHGESGR